MRIFMTGATGEIGRRVVPLCLQRGHEVTALARSGDGKAAIERLGARSTIVDIFDGDGLTRAMAGHDAVINLATHLPSSTLRMFLPGAWFENDRIRREGSANVAASALATGVKRLVQESYGLVYPDLGDAWIDETVPIAPDRYNHSVADAERSAARFTEAGGIGVALVEALERLARIRGYATLFAVSNNGAFFLRQGYVERDVPELNRERSEVSRFKGVYAKDLTPAID